jgi:hypothetical protein
MPTKERYASMSPFQKEMIRLQSKTYYEMNKEEIRRKAKEKYQENKEIIRENARIRYNTDPVYRKTVIEQAMKRYRKKNPEIKHVRRKEFPPKKCPNCGKEFIPKPQPDKTFCSHKCFFENKGWRNLKQYQGGK